VTEQQRLGVPGALTNELLQRLHVPVGQRQRQRLDRLALQVAQLALPVAPRATALLRAGEEQREQGMIRGEVVGNAATSRGARLISGGRPNGGGLVCMTLAIVSISHPPAALSSRIAAT